jgi:ferric-dicitrate binding protein FerR (iron transport regulator)
VLVKGSVCAEVESKEIMMKENELLTMKNISGETSLVAVNVLEHTSWKDGWMYCTKEKLGNIAVKLSRYYDIHIEFQDPKIREMTLTGKLDLKSKSQEVLDVISFIAPVDYVINNEGVFILSDKKLIK